MTENEKNLIDFAHKILAFKMNVVKSCKAKGIEPPTDEQMSEYINEYGLSVANCVTDFIEHKGIFRTPLMDFYDEIDKIDWGGEKPCDMEILPFFEKHGNDIELFCQQHTIKDMKPLERKVYLKTIEELPIEGLAILWNLFIEESALYGEDSYIYDIQNQEDRKFLHENMSNEELVKCCDLNHKGVRYIQWFGLNDKSIQARDDNKIKRIITAYWSEIFERIMLFPLCYERLVGNQWGINYFEEIVWPIITKEVGIKICTKTNKVEYCK